MKPATPAAYQLLHQGSLALAEVERAGIRIDVGYLEATTKRVAADVEDLKKKLRSGKVYAAWRKRWGLKANLGSREQLAEVLFGTLGHPYPGGDGNRTATGRWKCDEPVLKLVDEPFVADYLHFQSLQDTKTKYLDGLAQQVVGGRFHASYNLHLAATYRSSSGADKSSNSMGKDYNFQNLPIRDPEKAALIRPCFIPSKGCALPEMDYGGIEVKVACCATGDPRLIEDFTTPGKDPHRDTAAELFLLPVEFLTEHKDWAKRSVRDWAKNQFVFPEFYGSVYFQCAPPLWERLCNPKVKIPGAEISVRKHLRKHGIKELGACVPGQEPRPGTFEHHVRKVERGFWDERFVVYRDWKQKTYEKYLANGFLRTMTGFVCQWGKGGIMVRNDTANYPIQGPAFHCLLLAIIEVIRRLRKYKMKSRVVGQIHDSKLGDVPEAELQNYLEIGYDVMTRWVPKQWSWITVPLEVEADVAFDHWHSKKTWECKGGTWGPK